MKIRQPVLQLKPRQQTVSTVKPEVHQNIFRKRQEALIVNPHYIIILHIAFKCRGIGVES